VRGVRVYNIAHLDALHYIMHNAYTQAHHNLVRRVCIPRLDLVDLVVHNTRSTRPRRDYTPARTYSRDRNRRT